MSKITLLPIGSLIDATTAAATINANFATIQTAMDVTLSRDNTQPNTMASFLDMNSFDILNSGDIDMTNHSLLNMTELDMQGNKIINLAAPVDPNDAVRFIDIGGGSAGGSFVNTVFGRSGDVTATSGDYSVGQVTGAAALASPTFTGTPAAPTATVGTNTTQLATTAFVIANAGSGSVSSVFGRTGDVVATSGDYTVAKVTGAAPTASPTFTGTVTIPNGGVLGTPTSITLTNADGTASSLTAGHVTTNANLTGDVTSSGNATTLTNAPVIAKVLTGYTSGAGTVSATDSILAAIQKLNGNDATNANLTGDVTSVGNATTLTNAPVIAKVLTGYTSGAGVVSATDSILAAIQKLNGNDGTNANLTGVITSVGNATSIASQTGTGTKFVTDTSPTLVTPTLGVATATSINGNTFTTGTYTLTGTASKTLTFSNSLTLAGTDATTMTFPSTSATIARTDAANTFTGHQTIEGVTSTGATGTGSFVFSASPALTGVPTAPTASLATNTTQIATTAFVIANATGGAGVTSVFTRTGSVTASSGDYTVAQVTGAAPLASPTFTGTVNAAATVITSASATAFTVGLSGSTNSAFTIDSSTALQVAGLKITGAATGGTVALVTTDSGAATNLTINAKGTGTIGIGSVSTGVVTITPAVTHSGATTLSSALTYGGVTLSNAVTGTGNMVLSATPTFTGAPVSTTASVDTNTTQIATTAFVLAQAASATPLQNATAAVVGTSTRFARADHVHPTDAQIRQQSKSAAYTTVLADAGMHIFHPSADTTARIFTIDSNANVAYPIGTTLTFVNQNAGGVITVAITTDTMRLAGAGTTGSRTLAANGIATALKVTSTEWIISGTGLT